MSRHRRLVILMLAFALTISAGCERSGSGAETAAAAGIAVFTLRSPDNAFDIEQASGLDYASLGPREGLWLVCDRNSDASGNQVFFFSKANLAGAGDHTAIVADEAFPVVPPEEGWDAFAARQRNVPPAVLNEVRRRVTSGGNGTFLDLEAIAIIPDSQRIFVSAEEPFSTIIELKIADSGDRPVARIVHLFHYAERASQQGTDRNDGIEGLVYAGSDTEFYWAEEGTRFHNGPPGPRLFFLDPLLGKAELSDGRVVIDARQSNALTHVVRRLRSGDMQTLNALARAPDGRILAVDRNGGWILRAEADGTKAEALLNLYGFRGVNLREVLDAFPAARRMPYISIEGIAVDPDGSLWLVDDPAMPENFRNSALIRIAPPPATTRPGG